MTKDNLQQIVIDALEDKKAREITILDVRDMTTIADTMIIASGTSDRHVRSLADSVIEQARLSGYRPLGVEGPNEGEWVLVDLQEIIGQLLIP